MTAQMSITAGAEQMCCGRLRVISVFIGERCSKLPSRIVEYSSHSHSSTPTPKLLSLPLLKVSIATILLSKTPSPRKSVCKNVRGRDNRFSAFYARLDTACPGRTKSVGHFLMMIIHLPWFSEVAAGEEVSPSYISQPAAESVQF